jgi:hypothetical protein
LWIYTLTTPYVTTLHVTTKIGIKMLGLVQHHQHRPCKILHQKNLRHGNKVLVSSIIFYSRNFCNAQLLSHFNYVQSHQERLAIETWRNLNIVQSPMENNKIWQRYIKLRTLFMCKGLTLKCVFGEHHIFIKKKVRKCIIMQMSKDLFF